MRIAITGGTGFIGSQAPVTPFDAETIRRLADLRCAR
jgi:nucleoside-diphosphate-sugar epimerase